MPKIPHIEDRQKLCFLAMSEQDKSAKYICETKAIGLAIIVYFCLKINFRQGKCFREFSKLVSKTKPTTDSHGFCPKN